MAIRTPEQYLGSLNDGREIWFQGERAKDMSQHPHIRTCAEIGAMDYALCQDPRYQDLLLEKDKDGEPYHFVFKPMESVKDLLRRREIIQLTARTCFGMPGGTKFTGIDGLNAITSVSRRMDRELGTSYGPRVEAYRQHLKKIDAVARNFDGIMLRGRERIPEIPPLPTNTFFPHVTACNAGKYYAGTTIHREYEIVQDIAGGLCATIPGEEEYFNPVTGKYMRKCFMGPRIRTSRSGSNAFISSRI